MSREAIYESPLSTATLVRTVMNCMTWDGSGWMWEMVYPTHDEAAQFFADLDEDDRRYNAAEVLENAGWTLSAVCMKNA